MTRIKLPAYTPDAAVPMRDADDWPVSERPIAFRMDIKARAVGIIDTATLGAALIANFPGGYGAYFSDADADATGIAVILCDRSWTLEAFTLHVSAE